MPRIAMLFLPGTLLLTVACAEERLVEVIDLPPEFSGSQALTTNEDTPTEPLTITLIDTETQEGGIALQVDVIDETLVEPDGIDLIQEGASFTLVVTPALNQFGNTDIVFTATDSAGQETVETIALTVNPVNDPPVAFDQARANEGYQVSITLEGSDIENDPLTFRVVDAPVNGALEIGTDGSTVVYMPFVDVTQTDSFTFVANDGLLDSEPATVTINYTGINETPSALPDAYATVGGCAVVTDAVTGLLANDSDGDGDLITATLVTPPNHGSVDIQEDGSFIYVPSLPLHQSDSFTYISSDGVSDSEPATVSISIDSDGILVTTEEDSDSNDGLCSLREAIQAANTDTVIDTCMAGAGNDRILFGLSSATYPLSLSGVNEEVNGSGDLDILASVTIIGCGHANTVVDGLSADRVIDVQSEGVVRIENLSIYGGLISEGFGGGIRAQSTLELAGVNFEANHAIGMTGSDGSSVGGGGGGGGAAGLGGAIYSFDAYVTIEPGNEGCVFTDNIASGGNGGNGRGNGGSFTGNGGTGGGYFGGQGGYAAAGSAGGYASGGGGGGGNYSGGVGGLGGFGGGGGGGGATTPGGNGGNGGTSTFGGGHGGIGCCSAAGGGGGGAALGGAIFAHSGALTVDACTFTNNVASGGASGRNHFGGPSAAIGGSYGPAIFTYGAVHELDDNISYEGNTSETDASSWYHFE